MIEVKFKCDACGYKDFHPVKDSYGRNILVCKNPDCGKAEPLNLCDKKEDEK